MAYDEQMAGRVRDTFAARGVSSEELRMMGGLCFMVDGKMCVGLYQDQLMVRLDPEAYESVLGRKGAAPMEFTGRPMRGFVLVSAEGTKSRSDFSFWIDLALEFNPRAVASRRRGSVPRKKSSH